MLFKFARKAPYVIKMSNYNKILEYLRQYGGRQYRKLEKCESDEEKSLMIRGKEAGQESRASFEVLVNELAKKYSLSPGKVTQWQNSGTFVSYFWCQLKKDSFDESSISISIFAEKTKEQQLRFRSSVELAVEKASEEDKKRYRKILDLPLEDGLVYIAGGNNDSIFEVLEERDNEVVNGEKYKKVQISFLVDEEDAKSNDEVFDKLSVGTSQLLKYYEYAFDGVSKKNDDYWPSLSEFDPGISRETWTELLNDDNIFDDDCRKYLAMYYDSDGDATLSELEQKYNVPGDKIRQCIINLIRFNIVPKTGCPITEEENAKYWPVMFLGKEADKERPGNYIWKLRPEVYDALTEYDILRYLPNPAEPPMETIIDKLTTIKKYIASKGFAYDDRLIDNFYLSLKSKPFVILAGISGTGKSKIAQLFAEAIGADFSMVSVKPDWSDSTDLLGYVGLDGKFNPGRLTLKLKEANENPDKSYIICLDEMNLARVEYYFSDFLSVIETMRDVDGKYRSESIFTESDFKGDETAKADYGEVHISSNVYVVGTVNMDETTFPFSKKVLDRANTIEFSEVSLGIDESVPEAVDPLELDNEFLKKEFKSFKDTYATDDGAYKEDIKKVIKVLESINRCLDEIGAQVAYRVRDEIAFYMATARKHELMDAEEVLDLAIMQKILPRVQGSSGNIRNALVKMAALLLQDSSLESSDPTSEDIKNKIGDKYPRSLNKIAFMLRRYELDGYTSYWI